ncbi:MAG: DnaB-like helicase C-terminal domain-containing protein [Salinivirgaceae bacterium]|nr:DnaB-like helicase C-terminal domain-containing protein [Salinivirgaceae bacterium]
MAAKLLSEVQKEDFSNEQCVASGFEALDKITGGFRNSNLAVIAGRPAMGCRTLALTCAYNQACAGKKVAVFSVTLSEAEIANRLQNIHNILGKKESGYKFENQIFVNNSAQFEINELRYEIARLKLIENIDIVYIDNILSINNFGTGNYATVAAVTEKLQQLSRDVNIPVVALSSLTRSCESPQREIHYPNMYDLRFAKVINHYADTVLLIYRPDYYGIKVDDDGNSLIGVAELLIEKSAVSRFDSVTVRFEHDGPAFCDKNDC